MFIFKKRNICNFQKLNKYHKVFIVIILFGVENTHKITDGFSPTL